MSTLQNYFHTSPAVDGEWPVAGYDNTRNIYSPAYAPQSCKYAQNFIPTGNYTAGSVKLPLERVGNPGTVTVELYAVDGAHKPTGSALASGTTNGNTLTDAYGWTWREITFSAGAALTSGTEYSIVVSCAAGDETNFVCWWYNDGTVPISPAPKRSFYWDNDTSTWSLMSNLTSANYEVYDAYTFTPPVGGPTKKRLIAAAYNKIYYETTE